MTTTSYTYDAAGEELTVSQPDPDNAPNGLLTTATTYDADGNAATVTDPKGNTTSYHYDMLDNQTSETASVQPLDDSQAGAGQPVTLNGSWSSNNTGGYLGGYTPAQPPRQTPSTPLAT